MGTVKPPGTNTIKYLPKILNRDSDYFFYSVTLKKNSRCPLGSGFTFIELIISSSIFLIIMLAIFLSFRTGIFGYENIDATVNVYHTARKALNSINLDLRNSFAYSANETKFGGTKDNISFLALVDKFYETEMHRDYAFVSYKLEGDKLVRLCRRNKEALNDKIELTPQKIASDIEEITFSYGYIAEIDKPIEWKEMWDNPKELPIAIKVNLTLNNNKAEQNFERTIYLP